MSSARKRQKAGRVAALIDSANQQKMLAQHNADVMGAIAEEIGRRHDQLAHWQNCASAVLARFVGLGSRPNEEEWGQVALEATRLMNMPSNGPGEGLADGAAGRQSSREAATSTGLLGAVCPGKE